MTKKQSKTKPRGIPDWRRLRTYRALRQFADKYALEIPVQERWPIMERMRQVRFGYEPGELKMQKTPITQHTLAEFREITDREYEEEIKKYGPR